jgi:hypothetical protein
VTWGWLRSRGLTRDLNGHCAGLALRCLAGEEYLEVRRHRLATRLDVAPNLCPYGLPHSRGVAAEHDRDAGHMSRSVEVVAVEFALLVG